MKNQIDYYLSLVSPWTFLGHQRLVDLAAEKSIPIHIYPVSFGSVFAATGGLPLPKRAPERQAYRLIELARWRDYLNIDFNIEPKYFPADDNLASRVTIAQRRTDPIKAVDIAGAVLRATWVEERDVADEATLRTLLQEQDCDAEALLNMAQTDDVKSELESDTKNAIAKGVFGAPTYVVDSELFWGQDRLDFLARKLS